MTLILHRAGDQRFVLQSAQTGDLVGLLFAPSPNESRRAFEYDFGSTSDRGEIINIADFPEFAYLTFFTVESAGAFEFERAFQSAAWAGMRPLFGAAAKAIGYHRSGSSPTGKPMAAQWQHTPANLKGSWKIPASALAVTDTAVWMGNREGLIHVLNHQGDLINQYQLPKLCRGLAETSQGLVAICDDGQVYEFSDKLPQPIYDARTQDLPHYYDYRLQALTVQQSAILLLDAYGNLTKFTPDWQVQWQRPTGVWQGWVLQADEGVVYVGHFHGVMGVDVDSGEVLWSQATPAPVLCGVLLADRLLVGTSDGSLYTLQTAADRTVQTTTMPLWGGCEGAVFACALGDQADWLVASDGCGQLYGFNQAGDRRWQYTLATGSLLNMQVWGTRIYGTSTDGSLLCFEFPNQPVVPTATPPAQTVVSVAADWVVASPSPTVEPVRSQEPNSPGVIVECFQQGRQLKVRVISPGYHADWHVQFPRNLRQLGQRYRVTALQAAKQGGFYRVVGTIEPYSE